MTKRLIVGVALIVLGVVSVGVRRYWLKSIHLVPVDMSLSMVPGHVTTGDFRIDVSYPYLVELHFHSNRYPDETADCLTGMPTPTETCADTPSVVQVDWTLSSTGRTLAKGTTRDGHGYWGDGIVRNICVIPPKAGAYYKLDLNIVKDGSRLASMNPRLTVRPGREFVDDWGATYFFVEPLGFGCAIIGVLVAWLSLAAARAPSARAL